MPAAKVGAGMEDDVRGRGQVAKVGEQSSRYLRSAGHFSSSPFKVDVIGGMHREGHAGLYARSGE